MADDPYQQVAAVLHVHSDISPSGVRSPEEIAALAQQKGVGALIPTDHFSQRWEYGFEPFPGLFRVVAERSSVQKVGAEKYLKRWERIQTEFPSLTILPGVEAAPAYYWTGRPSTGDLTLNEPQRHLLVMGLSDPDDLRRLPVLSNPNAGVFEWRRFVLPAVVVLCGGSLLLVSRWVGALLLLSGLLWAGSLRPFRRLPAAYAEFTRNGYDAAQHFIDYVNDRGGMAVWAHPEAPNWAAPQRFHRKALMRSAPYPEALLSTENYAGFAYFWEGDKAVGGVGGIWDQVLGQYAQGRRKSPCWAFGEVDWKDDDELRTLRDVENVAWVRESTPAGLLEAFRRGRFYVRLRGDGRPAAVTSWEVFSPGARSLSGETARWDPTGSLRLVVEGTPDVRLEGRIFKNGGLWKSFAGRLPLNLALPLADAPAKGTRDFYRAILRLEGGVAFVMNPIFVE